MIVKNKKFKVLFIVNKGNKRRNIINNGGKNNSNLCFIKLLTEIFLKKFMILNLRFEAVSPLANH